MLGLIVMVYLLLALRIRFCLEAVLCGIEGSLLLSMDAGGIMLRFDAVIGRKKESGLPSFRLRYRKRSRNEAGAAPAREKIRVLRRCLWLVRASRMNSLSLKSRVGLGEAGKTALAAGCLQAIVSAGFSHLNSDELALQIVPDDGVPGFAAHVRCIFSCQLGDIMLAAARAALRKNREEGLGWKSIPLRA